jgi:hypothetical protein
MLKILILVGLLPLSLLGQLIPDKAMPFGTYSTASANDTGYFSAAKLHFMKTVLGFNQHTCGGFDTIQAKRFADSGIYPYPWGTYEGGTIIEPQTQYAGASYFRCDPESSSYYNIGFVTMNGNPNDSGWYYSGEGWMLAWLGFVQPNMYHWLTPDTLKYYPIVKIGLLGPRPPDGSIIAKFEVIRQDPLTDTVFRCFMRCSDIPVGHDTVLSLRNDLKPLTRPDHYTVFPDMRDTMSGWMTFSFYKTNIACTLFIDYFKIYDQYGKRLVEDREFDNDIKRSVGRRQYDGKIQGWFVKDTETPGNYRPFAVVNNLTKDTTGRAWNLPVEAAAWLNGNSSLWGDNRYWADCHDFAKLAKPKMLWAYMYPIGRHTNYAGYDPGGNNDYLQNAFNHFIAAPCDSIQNTLNNSDLTKKWSFTPQYWYWLDPNSSEPRRIPTKSEVRCETFIGLCYKPSSIIGWRYDSDYGENGMKGIIYRDGSLTSIGEVVRDDINPYIKAIDSTYMGLRWLRAYPYCYSQGMLPPNGSFIESICVWARTSHIPPHLEPDLGWYHIGEFEGPSGDQAKYFMLVNRTCSKGPQDPTEAGARKATVYLDAVTMNIGNTVYVYDVARGTRTYTHVLNDEDWIPYTTRYPYLRAGEGKLYRVISTQWRPLVGRVETDIVYQGALNITGDVTIPSGETLRIVGPAEVTIDDNYSIMLEKDAVFIAEGFDSTTVWIIPAKNNWGGIYLDPGASLEFSYCNLNGNFDGVVANYHNRITMSNCQINGTTNPIEAIEPRFVFIDSSIISNSSTAGLTIAYPDSIWISRSQFTNNGLYAMCIISPIQFFRIDSNQINCFEGYGIKYYGGDINAVLSGNNILGDVEYPPKAGIYVDSDPEKGDPLVTIEGGNINFCDIGIQLVSTREGTTIGPGVHSDTNYSYGIALEKAYADIVGTGDPEGINTFNCNELEGIYALCANGFVYKSHFDSNCYSGAELYDCDMNFGDSIQEGGNSFVIIKDAYAMLAYGNQINAINNWWGTADSEEIRSKVTELVIFEPFLTEEPRGKIAPRQSPVPVEQSLACSYPNPFNIQTKIDYAIPTQSPVSIRVYNILGQEIRELISQDMQPGYYSIIWDGKDNSGSAVSSGVYFYVLRTPEKATTKKMVVLK